MMPLPSISPTSQALVPLEQMTSLTVRQSVEMAEVLVGWETKNRYQVFGPAGERLLFADEIGGDIWTVLLRKLLKNIRPFEIEVRNPSGALFLHLESPWRWFFSTLRVFNGGGSLIGSIQQRLSILRRHYDVLAPNGRVLATLEGPLFKPWTFEVKVRGRDAGKIRKRWSGLGKEMFSSADNFTVEFGRALDTLELRQLLLAATFLIDFMHFERTPGSD